MGPRPVHLNLSDGRADAFQPPKMLAHRDMPSPRTGEVPPALSPLDAFAMHSRMLAKRFEEQTEDGRRMSRLPPTMVAKEMSNRPGYFRSLSAESGRMSDVIEGNEDMSPPPSSGRQFETSPSKDRPMSHYPLLDNASVRDSEVPPLPTPFFDAVEQPQDASPKESPDYFGMGVPRASSPEPVDPKLVNVQAPSPNAFPSLTSSIDTVSSHPRTMTNESQRSQRSQTSDRAFGLAPPHSPRFPKSPRSFQSIRSVPPDSGDEDDKSYSGSHAISSSRKFSGSSGMSRPQSPFSPWMHPVHRSPSMTSEYSVNGSQHRPPRPTANFSRPMSSAGSRPSFDTRPSFDSRTSFERLRPEQLHRQASGASSSTEQSSKPPLSRGGSSDNAHSTAALNPPPSGPLPDPPDTPNSASYIYAKYKLPRGRPVDRDSEAFRDSWIQKQFEWDQSHDGRNSRHERTSSDALPHQSPALSDTGRIGRTLAASISETRSKSADPRGLNSAPAFHRPSPSIKTISTDRTIKATPLHQKSVSADLTAEEHLDIGVACHDAGETNKSTYHFRLAAIAGLPTGMLLYALACRHGWGMRASPEEGVKWLRKAIDAVGVDVKEAEEKLGTTKLDPVERKKRIAQYALGVYELGNSSMNGWGCAKDKALAVRCYEIAGSWGDADALAEAGFCYVNGVGVKKDYKKAASLYRQAAEKGASMAGQSWIYKPKYMDDVPTTDARASETDKARPDTAVSREGRKEDKPAGRARSRSIWGRSKKEKDKTTASAPALPQQS